MQKPDLPMPQIWSPPLQRASQAQDRAPQPSALRIILLRLPPPVFTPISRPPFPLSPSPHNLLFTPGGRTRRRLYLYA